MKIIFKRIQLLLFRPNLVLLISAPCLLTLFFSAMTTANALPKSMQESSLDSNISASWTGQTYLDPSFGNRGIVTTTINMVDQISDMVIQSDDNIVVSGITRPSFSYLGDQLLMRYLPNGSLDTSFGVGGIVTTVLSSEYDIAHAVTLQPNNKIVTVGHSSQQGWLTIARYNVDGSLDNLFGSGSLPGVVTTTIGTQAWANDVALQPSEEIVAVGASTTNSNTSITLVRYLENGTLDSSFGNQGVITTTLDSQSNRSIAYAVALQSDGKIVLAGYDDRDNDRAVLARYHSDGTLDTTFGTMGIITETFGTGARYWALVIQPDGKILTAGESIGKGMLIARYHSDGTLDTNFANNGVFTMDEYGYPGQTISDIALFEDGKIVAAGGEGEPGFFAQQMVVVLEPDGSFSNRFGGQGWIILNLSSYDTTSTVSTLDYGKVITVGTTNSSSDILLAQYLWLLPQAYLPFITAPDN